MEEHKKKKETTKENKFTKEQFLKSKNLKWGKDMIQAILKDEQFYSKEEAEKEIKTYLEGKRERKW